MTDVILDTNVWVSSFFWKGPSFDVLDFLIRGGHRIFTSQYLLDEFEHVLQRDFHFNPVDSAQAVEKIASACILVTPGRTVSVIRSDPSDNRVLECALESNAAYIITQDKKHLLVLKEWAGIPIVSPNQFLTLV
ncbi:putative toxin-antitoxin system toxin component, PIN family [Candidatus Micrarchaeota archaeon]|nr:putative toxin-antitoxin system toxin component, PIN family [Candidatus Micrarchaeota archaeon]